MKKLFGVRFDGKEAYLYTISRGDLSAEITDHGATLVKLFVPDSRGQLADVVLGFDSPDEYTTSTTYFGATIGRNSNRVGNASFILGGKTYRLNANDNEKNNLHSGWDYYKDRLWQVVKHTTNSICLRLDSPDGDQGFPGNAVIHVTYTLDDNGGLVIAYDGVCDKDTVFNLTNHSYFNLAGHDKPELAMSQTLSMPARFFNPDDALSIPTGELRSVAGTPMDFRESKPIGRDILEDYEALNLQGGYDHNFEAFGIPAATLCDPVSGRTMTVTTDCPGIQFYSGNFLHGVTGKDGVSYTYRGGVALETQFYPDSVNHPEWPQPFVKAGEHYHSVTTYRFV
ncbi:MAG: galactose mutarotase [Oscillospiraceae bacterium]|nr:galactose mutarotase [Oscillospiraceae bacterium]